MILRSRLGSMVSAIALLGSLAACSNGSQNELIHASGHIEATEVHLAAKVGGRLLEAPLQEGVTITAGELVARFDTIDLEHQLAQARATLDGADAQLALLLAGSRAEDLRRAEENLARVRAELDAARRDLVRLEGLADRGSATEKARDDARTRREVAERSVAGIQAELDKLVAGPRRQEIDAARAQRAAAAARVAAIEQQITDSVVLAPRDGVLTERVAESGEMLPPGATLGVLTVVDEPWLDVWVDEPSLAAIRLGGPVEVRVDGFAGALQGTVAFVSPTAEFTPKNVQTPEERAKLVFRVKVALANADGLFKPGMPADAYFGAVAARESR